MWLLSCAASVRVENAKAVYGKPQQESVSSLPRSVDGSRNEERDSRRARCFICPCAPPTASALPPPPGLPARTLSPAASGPWAPSVEPQVFPCCLPPARRPASSNHGCAAFHSATLGCACTFSKISGVTGKHRKFVNGWSSSAHRLQSDDNRPTCAWRGLLCARTLQLGARVHDGLGDPIEEACGGTHRGGAAGGRLFSW